MFERGNLDPTRKFRIALVDDAPYFRAAVRKWFEKQPAFEVVAEAGDGHQAIEIIETYQPDLVLLDYSLPVMNGLTACRKIKDRFPDLQVAILSMFADDVREEATGAGACLCIGKGIEMEKLSDLIIGCCFHGAVA